MWSICYDLDRWEIMVSNSKKPRFITIIHTSRETDKCGQFVMIQLGGEKNVTPQFQLPSDVKYRTWVSHKTSGKTKSSKHTNWWSVNLISDGNIPTASSTVNLNLRVRAANHMTNSFTEKQSCQPDSSRSKRQVSISAEELPEEGNLSILN